MKAALKLVLTCVAGIGTGAALVNGLHAQAASLAYAIVDISAIKDPDGFKVLIPKASPEQLAAFGGKYIVRSQKFTAIDGMPPERFVVIQFDSLEKANAWAASADTKEINAIRTKTTESHAFIVEGM